MITKTPINLASQLVVANLEACILLNRTKYTHPFVLLKS